MLFHALDSNVVSKPNLTNVHVSILGRKLLRIVITYCAFPSHGVPISQSLGYFTFFLGLTVS